MQACTGIVTDTHGEPLIGATVKADGTNKVATTDSDGRFYLSGIKAGNIITVTYIGYTPDTQQWNGNDMSIQLHESSSQLDEVVVVGFNTQKKVNLTGAVSTVDMKHALGNRPISNVTTALQGVVPGLKIEGATGTPGESMTYNIRGTTSINGGSPLVLVNNVPMDIDMIDPQDIESVSVLKDAASAAIYGARAAFGVVLITTKQGGKDKRPKITYTNNFSFSKALELPQKASPLQSVRAYKDMGFSNDAWVDGTNIIEWERYLLDYRDNPGKYPDGFVFSPDGSLYKLRNNDMFDDMTDDHGFQQNHNIAVAGGTQRTSYRVSLGYTNEDGILITAKDKYRRTNLSSFLSVDAADWLTAQIDIRYANAHKNTVEVGGRNGVWGSAMALPSFQNIYPREIDGVTYLPESSATYIRLGEPRKRALTDTRMLGRVIIKPLKGLRITGEYTYNRSTETNRLYTNKYTYVEMNMSTLKNNVENSSYSIKNSFTNYNAINIFANYDITLAEKHDISATIGFNQEQSHNEWQYSHKTDVLVSNLPSLTGSTGVATTTDGFNEYSIRGMFYRIGYIYDNRYLLEANGRYDGSSRFPKKNRFGFFPSFSAGWRISEEQFMEFSRDYISNLKIRASYGSIGNQILYKADGVTIDNYPYIPEMGIGQTSWIVDGQKPTTMTAPAMVSNTLTWEKVNTLDFGLDFSLLNNRLSGTFDWYRRDTKDMLAPGMDLPWVIGATAAKQNAADLKTYGWELQMDWQDRIGDWSYRLGFNISDSQSEITKYNNETKLLSAKYYKGMKIGEIWGYVTDRLYTVDDFNADGSLKEGIAKPKGVGTVYPGDVLFKNLDDDPEINDGHGTADNPGDMKIIGNSTPRYHYGITAGVSWKGFDLTVFLRGVGKWDYWRTDQIAWPTGGWGSLFEETLDFWSPERPNAFYPRTYAQDSGNTGSNRRKQTRYLADASYIKLQNITLTYTLPTTLVKKCYLDDVKVFVSGENLHTWDHLPEGLESDMLKKGAWQYPFMKKFSFGINVTF